jgi:hypothetical protein
MCDVADARVSGVRHLRTEFGQRVSHVDRERRSLTTAAAFARTMASASRVSMALRTQLSDCPQRDRWRVVRCTSAQRCVTPLYFGARGVANRAKGSRANAPPACTSGRRPNGPAIASLPFIVRGAPDRSVFS